MMKILQFLGLMALGASLYAGQMYSMATKYPGCTAEGASGRDAKCQVIKWQGAHSREENQQRCNKLEPEGEWTGMCGTVEGIPITTNDGKETTYTEISCCKQ
jgi:hypothetical protein